MKEMFLFSLFFALSSAPLAEAQGVQRFSLRMIAVRTEAQAMDLLGRLQSGQQFAALASSHSIDPSARSGGSVGPITFNELRPEFQAALNGVAPGQVSRVARIGQTYFLLQLSSDEESRGRALLAAATNGDNAGIRGLVEAGVDVNERFENGLTALMNAAFAGHVEGVRILIAARADVNTSLGDGSTTLMAAALGGHADVVRALIDAGANVKAPTNTGGTALTEASHAGHVDVVRLLVAAGADVNAALNNGSTSLMAAALGGHVDVIRALVDAGADLNAKDRGGRTALAHAGSSTKTSAVKALLASRGAGDRESHLVLGTTFVNEYYSSNAAGLLESAAAEFQAVLDSDPANLAALEWMGAIEILQWGDVPGLKQFQRANSFLKKAVTIDAKAADRHYWIAATNWMFASRAKNASPAEIAAILDEGVEHARKAIELDPVYSAAMGYLSLLYRQQAETAPNGKERTRFLKLAETAAQDVLKSGNRPPRPNDQFSRPAAPPPPQLEPIPR